MLSMAKPHLFTHRIVFELVSFKFPLLPRQAFCDSSCSLLQKTSLQLPCLPVRLLGPPAKFDASKLKVAFTREETCTYSRVLPRIYTLSHCDFTANLTLTISNVIHRDQLNRWYNKDDVIAEWIEVKGNMCLYVHCFVSGPNLLQELAAEFRYLIFSKELPLVLRAVLYGDSALFKEHPQLTDASVQVFFHSSSKKYNHVECWGALKDAVKVTHYIMLNHLQGRPRDYINVL
ncbi:unnamed protein product [Cuscuta epithymum]|uniref:Staygreen protein domain-containing protein n=1 Tax=Cuscuta epithymum TaxID=186058 RepID=A0AAV0ESY1_9ASTE|nr:unnamed protein product [Cuscuta epithymum]